MKREMVNVKGLIIILCMMLLALCTINCDSTEARYKQMYNEQIAVNDTLAARITELTIKVNQISQIATTKIDSLKGIEAYLRAQLSSAVCDTGSILRAYGSQLDQYLFVPLNDRLNQVIDSLNRK